jgi:hypothetical protein
LIDFQASPAGLYGDGVVDGADHALILGQWGANPDWLSVPEGAMGVQPRAISERPFAEGTYEIRGDCFNSRFLSAKSVC